MRKILSNGNKMLDAWAGCGLLGRFHLRLTGEEKLIGEAFCVSLARSGNPVGPYPAGFLRFPGVGMMVAGTKNPPGEGWVGWWWALSLPARDSLRRNCTRTLRRISRSGILRSICGVMGGFCIESCE